MNEERGLTRRDVIATIGGGTVLGGLWGAAFPANSRESHPTISIVGHRHAQIALVDSSRSRFLILIGEPDESLVARLPALMTLFRQRIDVVIGNESAIARIAAVVRDRWSTSQAIAFQNSPQAPNLPLSTLNVTESIKVHIDEDLTLICHPGYRDEWLTSSSGDRSPLWAIELQHGGSTTVFAPDELSLSSAPISLATMIVTPDVPSTSTRQRIRASSWVVNHDAGEDGSEQIKGVTHTKVFPEDISRFTLGTSGIESPPWTWIPEEKNQDS